MIRHRRRDRRKRQRGSAMLVTLILIAALIAGGAMLLSVQMASSRSADLTRTGMSALYCAEAGLAVARNVITGTSTSVWGASLCTDNPTSTCTEPSWMTDGLATATSQPAGQGGDLDGDGINDFMVFVRDNDDEGASLNDPAVDRDQQLFLVSRCIKYPETPKQVEELIKYEAGDSCYKWMIGGRSGTGNRNDDCN